MEFIKKYWWVILLLVAAGAAVYYFFFYQTDSTAAAGADAAGGGGSRNTGGTYTGGEWNQGNVQYLDPSELTYMLPENWVPPVISRVPLTTPFETQRSTFNL